MQCGCPFCGAWTIQVQHGTQSHCQCLDCGWTCDDCMGGAHEHFAPITREMAQVMKSLADSARQRDDETKEA